MKDSNDATEKTSRRNFAKTVASALVAVPVVSSLSSCSQPQPAINPTPQPSPKPDKELIYSGNPPVIIDGGSLGVSSPATFERIPDNENTPKTYTYKFRERNRTNDLSLGPIRIIRITDDYGDMLWEERLEDNETLKLYLWIQKVKDGSETGIEEDDTDKADYHDIADPEVPDVVIQGGAIEIRTDKKLPKDRKLLKRKVRNPKRYERHDWDSKSFRIAQVKLFVSSSTAAIYTSPIEIADRGFKITLIFP